MVVQHNLTAMNSNRMLGLTTKTQAKATEKLSSGYRINRAADDAAGLAISEKMRKQIRGLTQASSNAQDGISAVQTAEGALNEVHDMLQRMNELAVKAANGTMSESDRDAIQNEIDQLTTEIDRVSTTTKFNETYLLKGANGSVAGSLTYTGVKTSLTTLSSTTGVTTLTGGSAKSINLDAQTGTAKLEFGTSFKGQFAAKNSTNGDGVFKNIKLNGAAATNTKFSGKQITVGTTTYVLIESTSANDSSKEKASASAVVKAINEMKDPAGTGAKVKAFTSMDQLTSAIRRQYGSELKSVTSYYDQSTLGNSQPLKILYFQSTQFFLHLHFSVDFSIFSIFSSENFQIPIDKSASLCGRVH